MLPDKRLRARALGDTVSQRCPDTGLLPAEMDARDERAVAWAQRATRLMDTTGCSAADALRAIAETDRQQGC